jgi:archaellum component FlaC
VEEALQRLDQLTQEECRMAAAEILEIARGIDDKVMAVDGKVVDVGDRVKGVGDSIKDVGDKVRDVGDKVRDVGAKVEDLDERVQGVNVKVEAIDDNVRTVDSKVQGVDHKVGEVIQGELYLHRRQQDLTSTFYLLGVKETGVALRQVVNQVTDLNRSSSSNLITADHESLTLFQEMSYARTSENGSLHPTRLSITTPRPVLITMVLPDGAPKATRLQFGKQLGPCYGFTENVRILSPIWDLSTAKCCCIDSWIWEEYSQVRRPCSLAPNRTYVIDKLRNHPRYQTIV